jgi:soluble lytic murein transglycosylase-like protein
MQKYADHPQAKRIYALALRRRPVNWKLPPKPIGKYLRGNGPIPISQVENKSPLKRSKAKHLQARQFKKHITKLIRKGWPTGAYRKLVSPRFQEALHPTEIAKSRSEIAHGYFIFGKDDLAIKLAKKSILEYPKESVIGAWAAGLAAWRSNKMNEAQKFFEHVALNPAATNNLAAAGSFWASRCHLSNQRPKKANKWLREAAAHEGTFYGVIAARALGIDVNLNFKNPKLSDSLFSNTRAFPQMRRFLALLQLKKNKEAEKEIRSLFYVVPDNLRSSLMAVAAINGMPGFAMRSAGVLKQEGHPPYFTALYPFPSWKIPEKVSLDPALVFAIVRQESQFYPRAKSRRGARGLMQLMPRTAAAIGRNKQLKKGKGRDSLFNPNLNLILGSQYITHLMEDERVSNNLFKALVAYNAGPGTLRKWERKIKYKNDPLLFIESTPSRETRHFIKKVALGLWLYRFRLNEPTPTLDQVAGGYWPKYISVGVKNSKRIQHAEN